MKLRTITTFMEVHPETFEPMIGVAIKRDNNLLIRTSFKAELVTESTANSTDEAGLSILNTLLEEQGEPPLTDDEIVLYKLTR